MPFDGATYTPQPIYNKASLFRPSPEMIVKEILIRTKEMISDPNRWCQSNYCIYSSFELQRCAVEALNTVCREFRDKFMMADRDRAYKALNTIAMQNGYANIETLNDQTTHAAVMFTIDEAIYAVQGHG